MARNTDLRIQIDADAARAEQAFKRAERAVRQTEDALWKAQDAAYQLDRQLEQESAEAARKAAQAQEQLGRGLVAFGAATLTGLGLATKAAIDWESAWAGVRKTVDGSDEEMAALEGELRGLTEILPASHREIAAVAEAAGQLGVQRSAVAAFTKVMIDLGETTNLTAEEAATAIAQLGNVLGFDLKEDVDNFGAALVELGNNGASTEAEILELAQRIGGAGAVIGLSADEVLGFAAAIANVGIPAEAGGTAISKVMTDIANSVATGGEELEVFAEVAGMSVDQFVAAFEEDPARAIAAFIEGLGRVSESGGNTFAVLNSVGFGGQRVRDVLLRLSESSRGVTTDLDLSKKAWQDNTALVKEAQERYETTQSKIELARNALVNLAIDIGGVILPVVAQLAESGADLLQWFSSLPDPVKAVGTAFGVLAGVVSVTAGGFLLLAPRVLAARQLMASLAETAPRAHRRLSLLGTAMKGIGLAATAAAIGVGIWASKNAETQATIEALADSLDEVTHAATEQTRALVVDELQKDRLTLGTLSAADAAEMLGISLEDATAAALGEEDALRRVAEAGDFQKLTVEELTEKAEELGIGTNELVTAQNVLRDGVLGTNDSYEEAIRKAIQREELLGPEAEKQEELAGAIEGAGAAAEAADPFLMDLAARFGETGEGAEDAAQQILDSWSEGFTEFVDLVGVYDEALAAKEEAERKAAQATADSTDDQSDSWEDYFTDVDLTFEEYLEALREQVEAQEQWATNMAILAARGVDDGVLDNLARMGPEGAPLVQTLVDGTDEQLQELAELSARSGDDAATGWATEFASQKELWKRIAETQGQETVDELLSEMRAGEIEWSDILERYGHLLDEEVPPTQGTDVYAETKAAQANVSRFGRYADHHTRGRNVPVNADTWPASNAIQRFVQRENLRKIKLLIEAKLEAFLGNFGWGGGGGGGGGGSQTGAWRTPMNRGTYRVGGGVGSYPGHTGQDLPAAMGTAVYAARTGRVSRSMDMRGSYGRHIYIDHPGGYQTRYAHLSSRGVAAGQMVTTGAYIGRVGSTGNSTGPHLHFELRQGGRVLSPRNYMRFASGGPIEGPGGPRDDVVPVWASSGEFMMQAAARAHYGDKMMHAINDMQLPKLAAGGGIGVGGPGSVVSATAVLSAEDRALLRAAADRPVVLQANMREVARMNSAAAREAQWGGAR